MSFTKTVKNELITIPVKTGEMLAEFSAFLNLSCELHISNKKKSIHYKTTNPTVARRFLLLSKSLYQAETNLLTQERRRFSNRPFVIIQITDNIDRILSEHSYMEHPIENAGLLTQSPNEKKAFLRAAFLVSGSVNHPKTAQYHLEIFANNSNEIIFIQSLMNHFNLNARVTKRRNGYIAYLKDAESISDFLQMMGAQNAVFTFEDIRIKRDFNNSINRIINCEIANEKKSIVAANRQFENIELIESYEIDSEIDERMRKTIELRKKYPEANLRELTEHYVDDYGETISRSGLNHRLKKIEELANKIRSENDNRA